MILPSIKKSNLQIRKNKKSQMTLFTSLLLTYEEDYLIGATSEGDLYVWLFQDLLMEYFKQQSEKENIYSPICKFSLKQGHIDSIIIDNDTKLLYINDDNGVYSYDWSEMLKEINSRRESLASDTIIKNFFGVTKQSLTTASTHFLKGERITSIDYYLKNNHCLVGTSKGHIFLIDLSEFTIIKKIVPLKHNLNLVESQCAVTALKFYNEETFIFGNQKGNLELWNYKTDSSIKILKLEHDPLSPIHLISFESDLKWVIVVHEDYMTRWHTHSGTLQCAYPITAPIYSVLPGDDIIYTGNNQSSIGLSDLKGETLSNVETSAKAVLALTGKFSMNEKLVIAGGSGPLVDVFLNSNRILSYIA